jgi:hypothetical protein
MKLLCCNRFIILLLLSVLSLFAKEQDKSAIVYYGTDISYPMVGVHDYIIVEPNNIDTSKHGFQVYKDKMYAYVSIGEIDTEDAAFKKVPKKLFVGTNKAWKSKLLNLCDPSYKEFLFKEMIEPQMKKGFKNFFFDTLDSYQLVAKTPQQRADNEDALVDIINTFHEKYPDAKLITNRGFEIVDRVHNALTAVLFESYYQGVGGEDLGYKEVSKEDRKWLDIQVKKLKSYKLDIICVDYLPIEKFPTDSKNLINKLQLKGFIPYVSTKELDSYGQSSKKIVKREILTLIDESRVDRIFQGSHQYGALVLENKGYIQSLYDVSRYPLPSMKKMQEYAGVVIWLNQAYKEPDKLVQWILQLQKYNIKVVFAGDFFIYNYALLKPLGINVLNLKIDSNSKPKVLVKDEMMAYEIDPSFSAIQSSIKISSGKPLYKISYPNNQETTLAAIMPWGGFAVDQAFMTEISQDNLWVINPFKFFTQALRLKELPVPDTTTQAGKRILFSHVDGDGIMNRAEWNTKLFAGDVIYSDILTKYKIPISISIIGAEVNDNGLYPKIAPQLRTIVKKMYALDNVEPATHTFTHPFFWGKIQGNGDLNEKYRLKPKGYQFSLDYEIKEMLEEENKDFLPKGKKPKAKTVFWSGDCAPTEKVLKYVYKNNILNINGGDTYITNLHPWLSYVAPMGLERGGYYQIYTGAQNENVYTNEWLGPFWGYKKVIQTFKRTNSPRRLKPIDVYYHIYSGSKRASLNALKYVYDWSIKQDVNPIFTSEYIPKVMDYYTVSIAEDKQKFFLDGFKDLKTVRLENLEQNSTVMLNENIAGFNHFETHTYLHLGMKKELVVEKKFQNKVKKAYLISSNGKIIKMEREKGGLKLEIDSHVDLEFELFTPKGCVVSLKPKPKASDIKREENKIIVKYKNNKWVSIDVRCKL